MFVTNKSRSKLMLRHSYFAIFFLLVNYLSHCSLSSQDIDLKMQIFCQVWKADRSGRIIEVEDWRERNTYLPNQPQEEKQGQEEMIRGFHFHPGGRREVWKVFI